MNLYMIQDKCEYAEESRAYLIWAFSEEEAKNLFIKAYDDPHAVYDGSVKLIIESKDPDDVRPLKPEPHIESRKIVERKFGFQYESDRRCSTCDLAECDGTCPVCSECDQCEECGHLDDCAEGRPKFMYEKEIKHPLWRVVEQQIQEAVVNDDIELKTAIKYVVGPIVQVVIASLTLATAHEEFETLNKVIEQMNKAP